MLQRRGTNERGKGSEELTAAPDQRQIFDCDRLFESLYRSYEGDVYRLALQLVGRREDAEDVTQVAFLNAYRALTRGNQPRTPRPWLFAIARNVCWRRFRAQQRRPREVQLDPEIFEARADGDGMIVEELRSALHSLSFEQRSALVLREFQGLTYADIAARLELSAPAVETLLFRARRALREELEKAGVTPSVPARRRRVIGWLVPWPSLEKLFKWLDPLVHGGVGSRAAGITAAAVLGTTTVIGTGVAPFDRTPAGQPLSAAPSAPLARGPELAMASGSAGRARSQALPAVGASSAARVERHVREAAQVSSASVATPAPDAEAAPRSTLERGPTASSDTQLPSLATPSPPKELTPPELEAPSLPAAPSEPPELEPPELEPPSLPAPEPPSLPAPPLPEPPELAPPPLPEPPSLPAPSLPPPPALPLP